MSKSGGIKAASKLVVVLLCMITVQTALAQSNAANIIDPQSYSTYLTAGSSTQFTVKFTNTGNETLELMPKIVAIPYSEKNIDESWVKITPTNATLTSGSLHNFNIRIDVPSNTESGYYQANVTFTNDPVQATPQYSNSMSLGLSVQSLPKIQLETQYLSDTIDAGKEFEYKIKVKNVATKDVTIDPKIRQNNYYDSNYIPAFDSDAIDISAPSTIKAGETADMSIKVKVPENAIGIYYGTISMNVDGIETIDYISNSELNLNFNVMKQPLVPYLKTFKTKNKNPITVEVSAYTNDNPWLVSPKREKPSFDLKMRYNNKPAKITLLKSVESGNVNIGGSNSQVWPIDDQTIYQSYGSSYVETYTMPGANGNWELSIFPKNMQSFGYSITVGDTNNNNPKH